MSAQDAPPRRERLADAVYGRLFADLAGGAWREGDRLPTEKELADRFTVSRPVVREAIQRLTADGLVAARQGSGTFVLRRPPERLAASTAPGDLSAVLRCLEVRSAIEAAAARRAAERRTAPQADAVMAAVERMEAERAAGAISPASDFAFHLAVAAASRNEYFADALAGLEPAAAKLMGLALALTRDGRAERAARVIEEHRRIAEAIRDGDPDGAEIAMRWHLDQARKRLTDRRREV